MKKIIFLNKNFKTKPQNTKLTALCGNCQSFCEIYRSNDYKYYEFSENIRATFRCQKCFSLILKQAKLKSGLFFSEICIFED